MAKTKKKKQPASVGRSTSFVSKPAPKPKTHVAGADLVLDSARAAQRGELDTEYLFWVGVVPECPVASIDMAGINFPKVNDQLIPDPAQPGKKMRRAAVGALVRMTRAHFERLVDRLPRTVIRFRDARPADDDGAPSGQRLEDAAKKSRRGIVITIPTAQEIKERHAAGKATRAYTPHANDEPAAHYMFAELCADQERGSRGDVYPPTLQDTGLVWPDALADEDDEDDELTS